MNKQELASQYWKQAELDFKNGLSYQKKDKSLAIMMAMQAAINAISSIPISQQKYQNPSYSLSEMLNIASAYDAGFQNFMKMANKLDDLQKLPLLNGLNIDVKQYFIEIKLLIDFCRLTIKKNKFFNI